MTETEWLTCCDPAAMLDFLCGKVGDRKLILFSLACWTTAERYRELEYAEIITELTDSVLAGTESLVRLICFFGAFDFSDQPPTAEQWARMVTRNLRSEIHEERVQLLRDIFGNPFRPVSVDPSWLTSTVVALAEGIYQDRAFDRMPILADALQDAGCDNDDILNHCRDEKPPHVRCCWVIDLLLGKS